MIRLSVTDLETWRYHKLRDDATLDDLLRSLARVEPPTSKMLAGSALAKWFERATSGEEVDSAKSDGWIINFNLDAELPLCPVREMKFEVPMMTSVGPVTLVGKTDGFGGVVVRDQKLTDTFDVEGKYVDSLQWRAYLAMLKARKFIYDVFVGKVSEKEDVITITEYHPVTFYSYPEIERDVLRAVNELAVVVDRYGDRIQSIKMEQSILDGCGK